MSESRHCRNCKYCEPFGNDDGYCKINPPSLYSDRYYGVFPAVLGNDWCGKFESIDMKIKSLEDRLAEALARNIELEGKINEKNK